MTRVLHVGGGLDRGGIETWLMHILRVVDRGLSPMDILVHTARPCANDNEARAPGASRTAGTALQLTPPIPILGLR